MLVIVTSNNTGFYFNAGYPYRYTFYFGSSLRVCEVPLLAFSSASSLKFLHFFAAGVISWNHLGSTFLSIEFFIVQNNEY